VQTIAIGIFCKTPAPGVSKTRLSPPLRPDECAAISACFIRDLAATIADVAHAGASVGYAVYTPLGTETALRTLLPPGFRLLPQCEGDFGVRLMTATRELLRTHAGAIMVQCRQSDLAGLDPERGRQRHAARQCRRVQPRASTAAIR
jgi:glycosyltransferase A (GT-A) superfamily protein (DUF2064 family)